MELKELMNDALISSICNASIYLWSTAMFEARYGGLANARLNEPCGDNVAGTGSNTVAHPAEACEIVFAGAAFRTQFGERLCREDTVQI